MTVVQVTTSVARWTGGLFESVRHLSRTIHLSRRANIIVYGAAGAMAAEDARYWDPVHVRSYTILGPQKFGYAPRLLNDLVNEHPDLVHLHGLWKYSAAALQQWSSRTGKPFLISPRGMLEPWALRQSPIQKRVAGWLFQNRSLRRAACIHATSPQECESIREAGFTNPIAIIPNGVEVPVQLLDRTTSTPRSRRALFLSRIHPKKGLLNLIDAWHEVRPIDWQLTIVGPDEDNHLREVAEVVEERGLQDSIRFREQVFHDAKAKLYADSDLFILPSFSENFGIVVGEALAHGLPVITTRGTPWRELERHRCGWWVDIGVAPLAAALKQATSLPNEELREMGERGRCMVQENYSWNRIASEMVQVYEWALGGGTAPGCVRFD
jgi:glycosyltransferase involved in cell wall biosynthesis